MRRANSLIDIERWTGGWREHWPRVRQAVQTAVAACIAYGIAEAFAMPQGFWAVVTAIIVTQANVGASLGLAFDRLLGSLLGVVVGGIIAVVSMDAHAFRYVGLGAAVLVLAYFSAKRPSLRIACVTAAIVVLGDPRFGPPISSAGHRMAEILIGTVVALLTTLLVFPSRSGPAFAGHVARTLPLLLGLLGDALTRAIEGRPDDVPMRETAAKVRTAFASAETLAREARYEVAGFLADHPDPDAVLRTLRRLWHTVIMLMRATASPFQAPAVTALRPALDRLSAAVAALPAEFELAVQKRARPDLAPIESALDEVERTVADMRAKGELRAMATEEVIRLMAFDFALGQLRANLSDLADRGQDLAGLAGSAIPWLRGLRAWARA